ncbi:hypothetical protein BKA65DRAFT_410499, partial [Rhexocercosporidium sp. MPI-PUGE-AT-0058]
YQDFFARNFAWLLTVFAVISVALLIIQVIIIIIRSSRVFKDVSYSFFIASLFLAAKTAFIILFI